MNKKLFLKLGLLLLSLSLVACGQGNNSAGKDDSSKSSVSQSVSGTQSSEENIKTTSPSAGNAVESEQDDKEVQPDTQQKATQEEYYDLIKEAWQEQVDYINSIDDPKVKQSVQTAHSAAIFKANELLLKHPKDSEAINASLKKVLDGE